LFLGKAEGIEPILNATVQRTVAATSANTGGYYNFHKVKMHIDSRTLLQNKSRLLRRFFRSKKPPSKAISLS